MKHFLCLLILSFVLLCACQNLNSSSSSLNSSGFSKPEPGVIDLTAQSHPDSIKHWNASHLFQNTIEAKADFIDLTEKDSTSIDIRAFKHPFYGNDSTWVLGYVRSETEKGKEVFPGPAILTKYGQRTKLHFRNRLDTTMINNPAFPMFKKGYDKCKWYPIVYNLKDSFHLKSVEDMLYPKLNNLITNNGIALCGGKQSADSIPEMSSYYATTVHLHGSNSAWRYDGYPNSSYFDDSLNKFTPIETGVFGPNEQSQALTHYYTNTFPEPNFGSKDTLGRHGAILWYHDHSMMRTSINVYAGLLAPYIIEGENENQIFTEVTKPEDNIFRRFWNWLTGLTTIYENRESRGIFGRLLNRDNEDIPLVINDKTFLNNGFLYYNTTADTMDSDASANAGNDIQPEFFGNTMVVNGKIWPKMKVNAKTYRFRILNTCSSRTLSLGLVKQNKDSNGKLAFSYLNPEIDSSAFLQIGTESGLMTKSARIMKDSLLTLAPGERADVFIDFSLFGNDQDVVLMNFAKDEPFSTSDSSIIKIEDINAQIQRNLLTNVVMKFNFPSGSTREEKEIHERMEDLSTNDIFKKMTSGLSSTMHKGETFVKPFELELKEYTSYESIQETSFSKLLGQGSKPFNPQIYPFILMDGGDWNSERKDTSKIKKVKEESNEIWAIVNTTNDTHPIHIHLNRFEVLGRSNLENNGKNGENDFVWRKSEKDSLKKNITRIDSLINPTRNERGWKDVVQAPSGQITYIKIKYILNHNGNPNFAENKKERKAQFVYHCHILEHEDASMMRRLIVKH